MKKHNNDSLCDLLYEMRDSVNKGDLDLALDIASRLYTELLFMVISDQIIKCKLDCNTKNEEE